MRTGIILLINSIFLFLAAAPVSAREFHLINEDIIGNVSMYTIKKDESLIEIARKFDIGFNAINEANPGLDEFLPGTGKTVKIPTEWILPDVRYRKGIVVNLSEMRLYLFPDKRPQSVITYPIGIGDEGKDTPVGTYRIIEKIVNPYWYVPESIRKEKPELPGSDNPLGTHALRLSLPTVLIHGTDRPYGIGRRVSHGCMHLYPEDIPQLFDLVRVDEQVTIIREPVKIGVGHGKIYAEVHSDGNGNYLQEAINELIRKNLYEKVDLMKLSRVVEKTNGIPTDITRSTSDGTAFGSK
jgi:L,D-transpeptidase ErfK/SrfK